MHVIITCLNLKLPKVSQIVAGRSIICGPETVYKKLKESNVTSFVTFSCSFLLSLSLAAPAAVVLKRMTEDVSFRQY